MTWFLLSFAVFVSAPTQPDDSLLAEQTHRQVRQYVQAVRQGQQAGLNLWALATVIRDKPEVQSYLNNYLSAQNYSNPVLRIYQDTTLNYNSQLLALAFKAESPALLAAYLLAETDTTAQRAAARRYSDEIGYPPSGKIDYRQVINALLENHAITSEALPAEKFYPLHFFLFFNNKILRGGTFSDEYLKTAAAQWTFSTNSTFTETLGISTLFRIYYGLDQFSEIEKLYSQNVINRIYHTFPNTITKIRLLRMLDYSLYRLGYYNRSLDIIRDYGLPLARYLNRPEATLKMRIALGTYLYEIGKIEQSKQLYLEILGQAKVQNISISKARVFNNLAINYWTSGEFDRYLNMQFKALSEAKKGTNYALKSDILKNLFTYYRKNGDLKSAKLYLRDAQKLTNKKQNPKGLARLSFLEGLLYRDYESDFARALSSFEEALAYLSPQNFYQSYQTIQNEIALLFEQQQKYQKALQRYQQILALAKESEDIGNILETSINKANIYLKLGRIDSAEVILNYLQTKNLSVLDFYQLVKAKTVRARYLVQTGQPGEGADLLQPVIEQIVKRSRASGDLKTGFWQVEPEYLYAFEVLANLFIDIGQPEKAVEALDRLKTINDAELYQNPLARSRALNEKELSLFKRLTDQLSVLRKELLAAPEEERTDIQLQIDQLSAQKKTLDLQITARADTEPAAVNDVQRQMNAHERVLHITELNDTYYIATISRNSVRFKKIPLTNKLRSLFTETIAQMAAGKTDLGSLYQITELLEIKKISDYVNKLTIIPDSYLYQLPLAVLPLEPPSHDYSYGSTEYLIERFETSYKTSLNDFNTTSPDNEQRLDYVGYGVSSFEAERPAALPPLPFADQEIKKIAKHLSALNEKKVILNNEATEQAFRRFAPDTRILHMATHSTVSGRNPLFSSIYLSASAADNQEQFPGRIFAYELFELNLANDLIILNSCESASGSYLQGSGVVGLSRALRYAGAASLILNIWTVNDMLASEFAVKFYDGLNEGQSKAEALRNAKLYFLDNNNANPYFWGSYMLLGNEEAIIKSYEPANRIAAISFMIYFMGIVFTSFAVDTWRSRNKASTV